MNRSNILLTAFRNTSSEAMLERAKKCRTLFLPNDKIKDSEMLIGAVSNQDLDYVFCFGQKPLIRDKVCIETAARCGGSCFDTNFDCGKLKSLLERNGIASRLSRNAGTSFCNELYCNGLKFVSLNNMKTEIIFVHIPFMKNITDPDSFFRGILSVPENEW